MDKFKIIRNCEYVANNIPLKVYSISDNHYTLLDNIISLIKNIKRDPFDYEISYTCIKRLTKNNVTLLYMNVTSLSDRSKQNLLISLTNDMNLLIECLFYIAVNCEDANTIEYLMYNGVNDENIENITDICKEHHVESLKYIILNNYSAKLSLSRLTCKCIKNVCKYEDIDKLPIPNVLRTRIKNDNMIKEIFYRKDNIYYTYVKRKYRNYFWFIKKFNLTNIVNTRLFVKGVKEFKCYIHNDCGSINERYKRRNYILYCEITSYDVSTRTDVNDNKYIAIIFHHYKTMSDNTRASMKCDILEELPVQYNLIPKYSIYFSITPYSFDELNEILTNNVFVFSEIGYGDNWEPLGYYELNLELFVKP